MWGATLFEKQPFSQFLGLSSSMWGCMYAPLLSSSSPRSIWPEKSQASADNISSCPLSPNWFAGQSLVWVPLNRPWGKGSMQVGYLGSDSRKVRRERGVTQRKEKANKRCTRGWVIVVWSWGSVLLGTLWETVWNTPQNCPTNRVFIHQLHASLSEGCFWGVNAPALLASPVWWSSISLRGILFLSVGDP